MQYGMYVKGLKAFKLSSLALALALAGCGGGDGTDTVAPEPDLGPVDENGGSDNGNGGDNETPDTAVDFFLQSMIVNPTNIEVSDTPVTFTVTVKAVESSTAGAVVGKNVQLKVNAPNNLGAITIEGSSTQTTDSKGEVTYELKLTPQAIKDKAALLDNGFTLTASSAKSDGTSAVQTKTVPVFIKGDANQIESQLSITPSLVTSSVSSNVLNPFGDSAVLSVQLKNAQGALASDVKVGLGIANIDGVTISPAIQTTGSNGTASFTLNIENNLSEAARQALLSGIAYSVVITEDSGATKRMDAKLPVAMPTSDYNLSVTGSSEQLSAYGDVQQLTVNAIAKNSSVPTQIAGAEVRIALNNAPAGVSLSTNTVQFDANGKANVALSIADDLSESERKTLSEAGISYTVTLTEPNRSVTTKTFSNTVYVPKAQYEIYFNAADKKQLSSSGGRVQISYRVNNINGGVIAGQEVVAKLPSSLVTSGLLTLESDSVQTTDSKGEVSYTVRVPTNLTVAQKTALEKAGTFSLSASIKEASGVVSRVSSEAIRIGSDIGQSDIVLTASSNPSRIMVTDSSFALQVAAKRADGSAASDRSVKLVIDNVSGVTIVGNTQTTSASGVASFTVNISQSLTTEQRDAIVKSGIGYTAVLTDEDGTQSKLTDVLTVAQPTTSIAFADIASSSISEFGGTGAIDISLVSKSDSSQAISGQTVTARLNSTATRYGVTLESATTTTDFAGKGSFVVNVPTNLDAEARAELKRMGIGYQLSYIENGITYTLEPRTVKLSTPTVALSLLNASSTVDGAAGYVLNTAGATANVQAQLKNQTTQQVMASQPVSFDFDNKDLASLLAVNGQIGSSSIIATTNANGLVTFSVVVPSNLTQAQKEALNKQVLTATLTETLTGKQQQVKVKVQSMAAELSLLANQVRALNLNGGETQIEVTASDTAGNSVAGQKVFLALPASIASQGVTLVANNQTTDNSGKATFTIAVPNNLTDAQKVAIGNSFAVALSAADSNNNIVTQPTTVATTNPVGTQENISIGANKVVNTQGDSFKVFVRLANRNGAIANRTVSLNVDNPIKTGVTVSNGSAVTNSDGVATFDLTLENGANVDQALLESGIRLTAKTTTAENIELTQNYIVAVDNETIDSYQILSAVDKPTLNTGGDQTQATFRVTDNKGGILVGVPVQLGIENLESSGAALTTASQVVTDATGKVDVGVLLAANSINARLNHSVVVSAKILTPQYDVDGNVTMVVREQASLNLSATGTNIGISADNTSIQDGATVTVTTTLADAAGLPISNAAMQLIDASGNLIAENAQAATNNDGTASFKLREDQLTFDNNGNLRVFARAIGEQAINIQQSQNSIDLVKLSQAGISFIDVADIYNVNETQTINIQVRTDSPEQAQALIGKQVELQTSLGMFDNMGVITTKEITASNINGSIITVPVSFMSSLAGTAVLQAKVLGVVNNDGSLKYNTTVDTRFRATTPSKMLLQAEKSVIKPGSSTEIVATVKDANDVPVEGQTVVFSRASDSSAGRLSAATAVTDSKGQAKVVYQANASSPIGGVVINANLLNDTSNIGTKTTSITVSEDAVYTTLSFSNELSSDGIYYTVQGSISVMDGSGRAVENKEVSIKSYAIEYAQGQICALNSKITYNNEANESQTLSNLEPLFIQSNWIASEDNPNYNYILDNDEDINNNGQLDTINPVAIIGGTVSEDGYTFITNDEGRADFMIRYPLRYSKWVKVRFEATTLLNGSENTQSVNYPLPYATNGVSFAGNALLTPWIGNTSPFGAGVSSCVDSLDVIIDKPTDKTKVTLSPVQNYAVSINGEPADSAQQGYNSFILNFDKAYELGSTLEVNVNGTTFSKSLTLDE